MDFWFSLLGAVAGSSVLTALITAKATKKKDSADAAESMAMSAKTLVETMRVDIIDLKGEMATLRKENHALQRRVYEVEAELKVYKLTYGDTHAPVPTPNTDLS
jgi:hypothetical protein